MRLGSVLPLTHSSTWRGADPIQRARIQVLVEQVPCMQGLWCFAIRCGEFCGGSFSVLEASPTTLDMWVRQVRSSEMVTPRYLECLTGVSAWLCSVYWCSVYLSAVVVCCRSWPCVVVRLLILDRSVDAYHVHSTTRLVPEAK